VIERIWAGPTSIDRLTRHAGILVGLIAAGIVLGGLVVGCATTLPTFDEAAWRAKVKGADPAMLYAPNFKDGRFFNPWMPDAPRGFSRFLSWKFSPGQRYTEAERDFRPAFIPDAGARITAMPPDQDFILWAGHASFLIRLNGTYWLTDPMFSGRALVPKRKTPPGITAEEIRQIAPRINILLSHNHYDHLDEATLRSLPNSARVYVPLGLKAFVQGFDKPDVTEMNWWQEVEAGGGVTLVCLPMQHWSRRIGQEINTTLWASFLLITPTVRVYFGGDTGYFIGYQEFGRKYPGIDYALLPTTAYHPRWFMHYAHMDVDEALEAFRELGARVMIPQQWGTFHLGDEPVGYPAVELRRAIAERKLDPARFRILNLGEILAIPPAPRAGGAPR
jgi:L-ascorbate metabolism protein UlaG (beta-lactamase superfamily)